VWDLDDNKRGLGGLSTTREMKENYRFFIKKLKKPKANFVRPSLDP
jgi:hypothetical protein